MNQPTDDPYSAIAHLYPLEFEREEQDDIELFLNLARRTGGPVLEVGAGTGRIANALARQGISVTGVDSSAAMLAQAQKRGGRSAKRPRWVEADVRSLDLKVRFALAIAADNTFAHFHTLSEQASALTAVHRHLEKGGMLAVVLQNPYSLVIDPPQNEVVCIWEREGPQKGQITTKNAAMEVDLAAQLLTVRLWYDVLASDGSLQRARAQLIYRWFYPPELELLLGRAGFEVAGWYGSYDLEPYDADSPLLIVLAEKARRARDFSRPPVFLKREESE